MLTEVDRYYQWKVGLGNGNKEDFTGNSTDVMSPSFSLSGAKEKKTAATLYKKITKGLSTLGIKFGLSTGQRLLTS